MPGGPSPSRRRSDKEYDVPPGDPIVLRVNRRRRRVAPRCLAFVGLDGKPGKVPHSQPSDFDPRQRPWYVATEQSAYADDHRALSLRLVERDGRFGRRADGEGRGHRIRCLARDPQPPDRPVQADAELDHPGCHRQSDIFIETPPCDPDDGACLPGDEAVRASCAVSLRNRPAILSSAMSRSPGATTS